MTDINKLIEEEAEKYVVGKLSRHSEIIDNFFMQIQYFTGEDILDAQRSIASFILHQNRWRKVEEKLPDVRSEPYFIIARCKTGYQTIRICNFGAGIPHQMEYFGGIEWKPIE